MKNRIQFLAVILCLAGLMSAATAQLPLPQAAAPVPQRAAPRRIPAGALPLSSEVTSWMSPTASSSQNPLVYVSFVTGFTSGGTDIYEITSNGGKRQAQLIGALDKGGGPVAVDAQQNVYVVEANLDDNLFQVDSAVFRYPRGSTQGELLFTAPNLGGFGEEAMTVAADGSVYIAGIVSNTVTFSVVKFSPPSYAPQVLNTADSPSFPTGISLDASGNLFVGWLLSTSVFDPCRTGCITELPAGQTAWQVRVTDAPANDLLAGPLVATKGSLVFWTGTFQFDYIETVPAAAQYPSQIFQIPPSLFPPTVGFALAFNAAGTELWATQALLGAGPGTNVLGFDYPSGTVDLTFPFQSQVPAFITGIAASPAHFP
jgi:hypothetical protein